MSRCFPPWAPAHQCWRLEVPDECAAVHCFVRFLLILLAGRRARAGMDGVMNCQPWPAAPSCRRSALGGFDFMPRPSDDYYKKLPAKIGSALTPQQVCLAGPACAGAAALRVGGQAARPVERAAICIAAAHPLAALHLALLRLQLFGSTRSSLSVTASLAAASPLQLALL